MELLNSLSDDQLALLGCVAALTVCGILMSLSYYLGQFLQQTRRQQAPTRQHAQVTAVDADSNQAGRRTHRRDKAA